MGIKPYKAETETAFLRTLGHALGNILVSGTKYTIEREVDISQVLSERRGESIKGENLHKKGQGGQQSEVRDLAENRQDTMVCTGQFDFVVYEKAGKSAAAPVLAIELEGKEHLDDRLLKEREHRKEQICRERGFELIRVDSTYARRYNYMKEILIEYFKKL